MATSKLQKYTSGKLSMWLGRFTIRENIKPDWLITPQGNRLELDFLIEEINVAIEIQGNQHYIYVPLFHGSYENFKKRQAWDEYKRLKCADVEIKLFEASTQSEVDEIIRHLIEIIPPERNKAKREGKAPPIKRKQEKSKKMKALNLSPELQKKLTSHKKELVKLNEYIKQKKYEIKPKTKRGDDAKTFWEKRIVWLARKIKQLENQETKA